MQYGREASAAGGAREVSRRREERRRGGRAVRGGGEKKVEHGGGAEAARVVFFFSKVPRLCSCVVLSLHAVSYFLPRAFRGCLALGLNFSPYQSKRILIFRSIK